MRGVIISLREARFEVVVPDVKEELVAAFSAMGTKQVEDEFNYFRKHARGNLKGAMAPTTQWHRANFVGIIDDTGWKAPEPSKDDEAAVGVHAFPPNMFKASRSEFSLGEGFLDEFLKPCPGNQIPTPAGQQYLCATTRSSALLWCQGNHERLQRL